MINRSALKSAAVTLGLIAILSLLSLTQRDSPAEGRDTRQRSGERNVAGEFDYYSLVLSWSPTHCATADGRDDRMQCQRRDGRRYAFILHGLWPQYERGYPRQCRTRRKPFVPQPVINGMLDIMPSRGLIIHEYRAHGTCSGLDPAGYYALSRRLFEKIQIPRRFANPFETLFVTPANLAREFANVNPGLERDMIGVSCGRPGNRLKDVRICLTKQGDFRACGDNEAQRRLCRASQIRMPPVRSSRPVGDRSAPRKQNNDPLPGPRVLPSP
jgi:ribonuclease T2